MTGQLPSKASRNGGNSPAGGPPGVLGHRPGVGPLTTGPLTTGPVSTGPLTTGPLTTGPVSTGPVSTGPVMARPPARLTGRP